MGIVLSAWISETKPTRPSDSTAGMFALHCLAGLCPWSFFTLLLSGTRGRCQTSLILSPFVPKSFWMPISHTEKSQVLPVMKKASCNRPSPPLTSFPAILGLLAHMVILNNERHAITCILSVSLPVTLSFHVLCDDSYHVFKLPTNYQLLRCHSKSPY